MIDKNDPRLTAYLLDELNSEEVSLLEAELCESPDARLHLEGLRLTIERMHHAFNGTDSVGPTMTDSQMQQVDVASCVNEEWKNRIFADDYTGRIGWRDFTIAALALYAVGLSLFSFRNPVSIASSRNAGGVQATALQPETATAGDIVDGATRLKTGVDVTGDSSARLEPFASEGQRFDDMDSAAPISNPVPRSAVLAKQPSVDFDGSARDVSGVEALPNRIPESRYGEGLERGESESRRNRFQFGGRPSSPLPSQSQHALNYSQSDDYIVDQRYLSLADPQSDEMSRQLDSSLGGLDAPAPDPAPDLFDLAEVAMAEVDLGKEEVRLQLSADATTGESSGLDGVKGGTAIGLESVDELSVEQNPSDVESASPANETALKKSSEAALGQKFLRTSEDNVDLSVGKLKRSNLPAAPRTWRPSPATTNRARLNVGHHDDLALVARDTYVRIDGFRARVFFDCYYYNDRAQQLEGQFRLRLPDDASLHYFAFGPTTLTPSVPPSVPTGKPSEDVENQTVAAAKAIQWLRDQTVTSGSDLARRASDSSFAAESNSIFGLVKSARVAPRQKAAAAYDDTVRRRVDPALVEWAGPGIFQTRVFPLLPNQLHRIIIGYDVNLQDEGRERIYSLPLPEGDAGGRVEFDIAASAGTEVAITPETDAFISGGRAYYRFEHAEARDYTVRLSGTDSVVLKSGSGMDEYFATRIVATLPDAAAENDSPQAVFLLDTSWSDRPAAFSRRLKLLEQILEQNRDTIQEFAVLLFNVEQRWWRSEFASNEATNVAALMSDANQLALEGATDLHSALSEATVPDWNKERDVAAPLPNFFLLSDAVSTWGKTDLASMSDPLTQLTPNRKAGGGAVFAYHLAGHSSDKVTLDWLAQKSGGAVFDVAEESELAKVAVAHRSRPWQIVGATAKGAGEILIQGASKTVYPNQVLMVAGRGHLDEPLRIEFQRGIEKQTLEFGPELVIASPAAARLYGQIAVECLEPYAENLEDITVAFARYFRVPGRSCSLVMLDSQEDYQRLGVNVPPEEDQLVIASTSILSTIKDQESDWLAQRQRPRQRFIAWVDSLQAASLLNVSTALRLAMKRLPENTFAFDSRRLECRSWKVDQISGSFKEELVKEEPSFDVVMDEAERKLIAFGADDALKTASTAIEAKPSDVNTLRSVAFRAMQWQRSDQAAALLWRLTQARPYQPQCLLLLARAMSEAGDTDAAIVCFDLVSSGNWNARWAGAKEVAQVELLQVLEQVDSGEAKSEMPEYAQARLQQLRSAWCKEGLDVAVIMHWNTDRTDVDLHVTEPGGEECFYSHNHTAAGGRLTQDITEGLGPEMYSLEHAPVGDYRIEAKFYGSDANRTKAPTETLLTILRNAGRPNSQSQTKRITLNGTGEKQVVFDLRVEGQGETTKTE